uniref:Uncharacterized protein n=1 Tax=Oryza barthii TaxID=65489 RepID=A0A0D3GR62_9ORYZ
MVWLQENFGWLVGFGVPALCTVLAMASFLLGSAMYSTTRHQPRGSPVVRACQVVVDAIRKRNVVLPHGIVYCMVLVQQPLFTVQGRAMCRRLGFGAGAFAVPAVSLNSVYAAARLILVPLYDAAVVPAARRLTGNERGLTELQRIGAGMTLSVAAMAAAATVEGRRLAVGKAAARLGSGKRRAEQRFSGGGDGVTATTPSPRRQRGAGCWRRRARPWRRTS